MSNEDREKIGLALFVYKRPEHTKRVIESIKLNGFTRLHVFQDGLRNEKDRSEWSRVAEIVNDIDFAEVDFFVSKVNIGLAQSIVNGMKLMFEQYEFAIALEDDVILHPGYKEYVEYCFERYKDEKSIMSISGGGYGAVIPSDYAYDLIFTYRMSSVAFGTWADRWMGYERNSALLGEILSNPEEKELLKKSGDDIEHIIAENEKGEVSTWAAFWVLHQIRNRGFHIYPKTIYAEDIGRDGTGTNTTEKTGRYDDIGERSHSNNVNINAPQIAYLDERIVEDTLDLFSYGDKQEQREMEIKFLLAAIFLRFKYRSLFEGKKRVYLWSSINNPLYICVLKLLFPLEAIISENPRKTNVDGLRVIDVCNEKIDKDYPILVLALKSNRIHRHYIRRQGLSNTEIYATDLLG